MTRTAEGNHRLIENIVECKGRRPLLALAVEGGLIENIVECKEY